MQQLALPLVNTELVIRRSARAKRLKVTVNPIGGVEVVVPRRASSQQVSAFIQQQQDWIRATQFHIQALRHHVLDMDQPEVITFPIAEQHWHIEYVYGNKGGYTERRGVTNSLHLSLEITTPDDIQKLLSCWLTNKAQQVLLPALQGISEETGLSFNTAKIRAQKTRWGSCSAKKNISLNRCLLFLESKLVRYLMIHELCHTIHLNHSSKYWSLVEKFVPDYRDCEQLLDLACYRLPKWAIIR